jgi:hypothetical protein
MACLRAPLVRTRLVPLLAAAAEGVSFFQWLMEGVELEGHGGRRRERGRSGRGVKENRLRLGTDLPDIDAARTWSADDQCGLEGDPLLGVLASA